MCSVPLLQLMLRSLLLFWPLDDLKLLLVWDDESEEDHALAPIVDEELRRWVGWA
jgi:hypothetical protein